MTKNWIIFIVIFLVAYGWMITDQMQRNAAYEKAKEQYEIELAEWEAEQEAKRQEDEERKAALRQLREQQANGETTVELPAEATDIDPEVTDSPASGENEQPEEPEEPEEQEPDAEPSGESSINNQPAQPKRRLSAREAERQLLLEIGDPYEAPLHKVESPLYEVHFSELGGVPIIWRIKTSEFVSNIDETATTTTVSLIPQTSQPDDREYPFQLSGATAREFNDVMYTGSVEEIGETQVVTLVSDPIRGGMVLTKKFVFRPDSYIVDAEFTIENGTERRQPLGFQQGFGTGWQGGFGIPEIADRLHGMVSAVYASEDGLTNRTVSRNGDGYDITVPVEWAGQEKKYFASIIIPEQPVSQLRIIESRSAADEWLRVGVAPMSVEMLHPSQELAPGEQVTLNYQMFAGPKNYEALDSEVWSMAAGVTAPTALVFHNVPLGLDFLRGLCLTLLKYMRWLYDMIGAWGLAIIFTTVTVRVLIFPLTHWAVKNQARTMVEQERIRPELQALMKKYKSDAMKRSQAMMDLYREHNINPVMGPLRGCFPMLLQMPIFLALYVLFDQAVELRGQSFLWIRDLSAPDALIDWGWSIPLIGSSLNILPLIMAGTNYGMMRLMQMPAQDEMQEKIQKQMLIMMPIMMAVFLYHMPAGLTLYWTVSNFFSIGQSLYAKRLMEKQKEKHKARLESDGPVKSTNEVTVEATESTAR